MSAESRDEASPGTVFGGDFRILRPLASGGMGSVFVAEQLSTGRLRALKLMQPQLAADPSFRRRFEQEARIGSLIRSDHVVEVIAAGVDASTEAPWLVMELLSGEDLSDYCRKRGPVPPEETAEILGQLCHGLAAAHDVPIVHRDLKPENVFLSESRVRGMAFVVKILDFGIARLLAEARTTATAAIGTPLWMAPEQAETGGNISPPTDVWPLGLIAFLLLTGKHYWLGANGQDISIAKLLKEVHLDPLAPASERAVALGATARLPPGFDAWFSRCVARNPSDRFRHARDAWTELQPVLGAAATASAPTVLAAPAPDSIQLHADPQGPAASSGTILASPTPASWAATGTSGSGPVGSFPSIPRPPPSASRPRSVWFVLGPLLAVWGLAGGAFVWWKLHQATAQPTVDTAESGLALQSPSARRSANAPRASTAPSDAVMRLRATVSGATVDVPAGTFRMGALGGDPSEAPPVDVNVQAFAIDRVEVTVEAYAACVRDGACDIPGVGGDCNWGLTDRTRHPINCVSLRQAETFCAWAGKRLPTEAEWEFAARGPQGRRYPWGEDDPQGKLCWKRFDMAWGKVEGTCPVGRYEAGETPATRIADLAGNVAEWTSSRYCPHGTASCAAENHVVRGGARGATSAAAVRATARSPLAPDARNGQIGFRCAR